MDGILTGLNDIVDSNSIDLEKVKDVFALLNGMLTFPLIDRESDLVKKLFDFCLEWLQEKELEDTEYLFLLNIIGYKSLTDDQKKQVLDLLGKINFNLKKVASVGFKLVKDINSMSNDEVKAQTEWFIHVTNAIRFKRPRIFWNMVGNKIFKALKEKNPDFDIDSMGHSIDSEVKEKWNSRPTGRPIIRTGRPIIGRPISGINQVVEVGN